MPAYHRRYWVAVSSVVWVNSPSWPQKWPWRIGPSWSRMARRLRPARFSATRMMTSARATSSADRMVCRGLGALALLGEPPQPGADAVQVLLEACAVAVGL